MSSRKSSDMAYFGSGAASTFTAKISETERVGGWCLALFFLWRLDEELLLLLVALLLLLLTELERDLELELLLLGLSSSSFSFFLDFFLLFLDFFDFFFFLFFFFLSALRRRFSCISWDMASFILFISPTAAISWSGSPACRAILRIHDTFWYGFGSGYAALYRTTD